MTGFKRGLQAAILVAAAAVTTTRAEVVKVAVIDPLSGSFAVLGENQFRSWQYIGEIANKGKWAGDNTLEFVAFDNKASVQETLTQFQRAARPAAR